MMRVSVLKRKLTVKAMMEKKLHVIVLLIQFREV
jgi:hypothetical protein